MLHPITFESNPKSEDIQVLGNGIIDYAKQKTKHTPMEFFAFFVRDAQQKIIGGCNGSTLYGCLYIDQLWVDESIRQQGYGSHLVNAALAFGVEKHCTFATVNTMSWEALGFYQKLGFEIEFQRTGFEHGSIFYFLRKSLVPTPVADINDIKNNTQNPKSIWYQQDEVISKIIEELKQTYQCHTIILYGSRARGDHTSTSDYDIAGVSDSILSKQWLARFDEAHQVFHDIFIFPTNELYEPNDSHLQMSDGIVLIEKNGFGSRLLNQLNTLINTPLTPDINEREGRTIWYKKMLSRAETNDLEGKYRQIWTIHTLLEDYFFFRNLRYLGPKKGFQYLELHDKTILVLFEKVLEAPADMDKLRTLVMAITENRL